MPDRKPSTDDDTDDEEEDTTGKVKVYPGGMFVLILAIIYIIVGYVVIFNTIMSVSDKNVLLAFIGTCAIMLIVGPFWPVVAIPLKIMEAHGDEDNVIDNDIRTQHVIDTAKV